MTALERYEPRVETLTAATRQDLVRLVGQAMRRGELGATDIIQRTEDGRHAVRVLRVRSARAGRPWVKPVVVTGGAVLVLAGAAALGWWLVGVTASLLAAAAPALLAGTVLLLVGARMVGGGPSCTVTHIRHR